MPDLPEPVPSSSPPKRPGPNDIKAPPADVQLLTFGEVAYVLRVSVSTVRKMVDQGAVTAVRGVGRVTISRDDLDAYIKRSRVTFTPASAADAAQVAAERARKTQERKAMVVADWNTGKDYFNDDAPARRIAKPRPTKAKPAT